MLAHPELPESLIEPGISILSVMSPNERDLVRVVVEIINELRDPGFEEDVVRFLYRTRKLFLTSDNRLLETKLSTVIQQQVLLDPVVSRHEAESVEKRLK